MRVHNIDAPSEATMNGDFLEVTVAILGQVKANSCLVSVSLRAIIDLNIPQCRVSISEMPRCLKDSSG